MKKVRKSKTIGVNALGLLALIVPSSADWMLKHPREILAATLVGNILLRFISKDKVQLEIPPMLKKYLPLSMLYNFAIFVLFAGIMMGAQKCDIPIDRAVSAAEGHDAVVTISGYGTASTKGYVFIQLNEKASVDQPVTLTFPDAQCKRDSCVRFQFFRKDGSAGTSGALPRGQTQYHFALADVVGHRGQSVPADEGEYSVIAQVYWADKDGFEHSMIGNGFVRLNVLSEAYRSVACNDPNIAWKVPAGDKCEAQYTTAYRSAVCGTGCGK